MSVNSQASITVVLTSLVAVIGAAVGLSPAREAKPTSPGVVTVERTASEPDDGEIQRTALHRAGNHMDWADREIAKSGRAQLQRVHWYILNSKKGTRRFADAALSFKSKWLRVVDYVPFTRGDRSRKFLAAKFRETVMDTGRVERVIRMSTMEYVRTIEAIENEMMVRIERDVADLPRSAFPGFSDGETLKLAFDRNLESSLAHLLGDVRKEVAIFVASDIVALIVRRLMVSSAILGGGAAGASFTMGVSLAAAVIADLVIGWAWDRITDPRGKLARELNSRIDELASRVVSGFGLQPGLRDSFAEVARQRIRVRRQVLRDMLMGQGQSK
jgi:hypothetical protein